VVRAKEVSLEVRTSRPLRVEKNQRVYVRFAPEDCRILPASE